ncbi:imelysin family protein [Celeribacter indicus]|uniref:Imelysin-like domain-containing protein n=1 Tax=Celeribacter indicus TaxID=1208324 RepID=A0A0B5E303_9RHOB|nr:imelysin family protein [Celeribacter indicus]AJE47755.1 hypothetical protein P73_3040 [Celeribacter indicus]SDW21884.1 hypothetical protein SAMN05443573_10224 [Celeribacter indicus]
MRRFTALCVSLSLAGPLAADPVGEAVTRAVDRHATPAIETFAAAAEGLAEVAAQDCRAEAVKPAYHSAFDAWIPVQQLHLGPIEKDGRILAMSFWPDKKGLTQRTLAAIVADEDPVVDDPAEFAHASIAVRGFFALEMMLYDDRFAGYGAEEYACRLVRAITGDMARMAGEIDAEWTGEDGFADTLKQAGEAAQVLYLTPTESLQALYTQLTAALEFDRDQRIARPLGSFERPRPERAEARRSARSRRNLVLSLEAARDLARSLAPAEIPAIEAGFEDAIGLARDLETQDFSDVEDPTQRLELEIVGQRIQTIQGAIANEIGAPLGISAGFNAGDGD